MVVVAGLAAVLLAACGDTAGDDPGPTEGPATSTPRPTPPTLPETPPVLPTLPPGASPPPTLPTPPTGELTLTGDVVSGVEPGCVLLDTGAGQFLLIGSAADDVQVGTTATVRGTVRADLATTCQQGTPLEVAEVIR